MPVVVDPNAPDTWRDKFKANKTIIVGNSISAAYAAALAFIVWGNSPDWYDNLVYTFSWIGLTGIVFATMFIGVAWAVFLYKADDMVKAGTEGREKLADMSRKMREQGAFRKWLGRALSAAQIVFLYMLGWTAIGAIYLVCTLLCMFFVHGIQSKVKEIMMAKLSAA